MLFFMSFPCGVLYNKLMNTMNGITGDVTPPYLIAPSSVAPKEAPSPPNEVPSPRNMVPLLNLSQQLGATNAYFRATEFLWGRRKLGRQCKDATSPTTDEKLFPVIIIHSNFSSYGWWLFLSRWRFPHRLS